MFHAASQQAASANQNVSINIMLEKPEDWPPCLLRSERLVDSKQNLHSKSKRGFTEVEEIQVRSDEVVYIYLNAGIRLKIVWIPPVNTVPH